MEPSASGAFENVESDDRNPNDCTPKIESDFVGIRINAPGSVTYIPGAKDPVTGSFARLMICGIYRLELPVLAQTKGFRKVATLAAVATDTHQTFTGGMMHDHPDTPNPNPSKFSPEELKGFHETGYFNVNVLDYLHLPERPGEYQIFVTFTEYTSNVVTVTLKKPE